MLGASFHWLGNSDASYLRYNAATVAVVKSGEVVIRWKGIETGGPCRSIPQGKRYVERWLGVRLRQR